MIEGPEKNERNRRLLKVIEGGKRSVLGTEEEVPPPARPEEPVEGAKPTEESEALQMVRALGRMAIHGPYSDAKEGGSDTKKDS